MEPISQYYLSHRLKLHFWDWGDNGKPNLVLVHGSRDHARSWDFVAREFCNDFRVVAPDLRGHGDSQWAPGAMYSVPEYVLDLSALIDIIGRHPVHIIGHSLGGAVAQLYAGSYPERVRKLVSIEGFGPPPEKLVPRPAHERLRRWIEDMRVYETRSAHRYESLESAVSRMREANPYLSAEIARRLTLFGSNWNPDGSLTWKFDNFVRAFSPYAFNMEDAQEIWRQIRCPVLLVRGLDSWVPDPTADGRVHAFSKHRLVSVPAAGHWVHHDQPGIFVETTRQFFRDEWQ
jgi:pimeloyl-ACP methyl ester carboxylesterase